MKTALLTLFALLALACWTAASPPPFQTPTDSTEAALKKISQQLFDAVASGQTAVWDRYLDEGCLLTDEEGVTRSKAEFLKELQPLRKGIEGSGTVENAVVHDHGNAATIVYDIHEREDFFGQHLETRYRTTDTYLRKGGEWRMISSHTEVIPTDPPVISIDPAKLADYVGTYEAAPNLMFTVSRAGDQLLGGRSGRTPQSLWPVYQDVFFSKGRQGLFVFRRDPQGRVVQMLDRRKGNDVVWKRADK